MFNSNNKEGSKDKSIPNSIVASSSYIDSRYSSNRSNVTITKNRVDYYPIEIKDSSNLF